MAETQIDVKKTQAAKPQAPEVRRHFHSEIDRLFDFFDDFRFPTMRSFFDAEPRWPARFSLKVPAVDVVEDDKAYKITAELPGIDDKKVEVASDGDVLTIKGEKSQEKEEKDKNYDPSERSYGAFERSFRLPEDVDRDTIEATFANGVLTVTLPKSATAQKSAKKIEVKAAA